MKLKHAIYGLCLTQLSVPAHAHDGSLFQRIKKLTQEQTEQIKKHKKIIGLVIGSVAVGMAAGVITAVVILKRKTIFPRPPQQATQDYKKCCNDLVSVFYLTDAQRQAFEDKKEAILAHALLQTLEEYNLKEEFIRKEKVPHYEDGRIDPKDLKIGIMIEFMSSHLNDREFYRLIYLIAEQYHTKIKNDYIPFDYETFQKTLEFLEAHKLVHHKNKELNLIRRRSTFLKNFVFTPTELTNDAFLEGANKNKKSEEIAAAIKEVEQFIDLLYANLD